MKRTILFSFFLSMLIFSGCGSSKSTTSAGAEKDTASLTAGVERDGTSFEKAIIVSSVREEYEWAKKQCNGCAFVMQALVFHEKKPYDILTFRNPNGEEVKYYFDISKFYGKW